MQHQMHVQTPYLIAGPHGGQQAFHDFLRNFFFQILTDGMPPLYRFNDVHNKLLLQKRSAD